MTTIEQKLVEASQPIFGNIEKWNAFLELVKLRPSITNHWLSIGTRQLRDYFKQNPLKGWRCAEWGAPTDTRWYLEQYGAGSLAVGFGWSYEFHLHLNDPKRFDSKLIDKLLTQPKYAALLVHFDSNSKVPFRSGSKASRYPDFNFLSQNEDGTLPIDELAWYAAHEAERFVKAAAGTIESIIHDPEITGLITELNAKSVIGS